MARILAWRGRGRVRGQPHLGGRIMTFPGAHAQVYYNEAGEPIGWDYPNYDEPVYVERDEEKEADWEWAEDEAMEMTEREHLRKYGKEHSCYRRPFCEPDEDRVREAYENLRKQRREAR